MHTITLSADRREYNPNSRLALRYDWDDGRLVGSAALELQRIDSHGNVTGLSLPAGAAATLPPGKLRQFSLPEIQRASGAQLEPGETLQLKLSLGSTHIVLRVNVVEATVTPVPEAGYALLRWHKPGEQNQVECARFAWSPPASRIELVCPEDLRTEVVRRRAVFQWTDSVRPETCGGYAIQKVMPAGATHFPDDPEIGVQIGASENVVVTSPTPLGQGAHPATS